MRLIEARNVNGVFPIGMRLLDEEAFYEESRAGDVKVAPWPVTTIYQRPMERVLFDPKRDANPFFHLMEGLWMLAGREDSAFLNRYVATFGERFAEKDGTVHDAYGQRWRESFGFDQLDHIAARLRSNPQDRQCVLQMWDANVGEDDLTGDWRGRPCNTHAYFRLRDSEFLDMTICCRSNDAVWGAHGANAVHFSMLLEYMAGRIGVGVGKMYQHSNNYHGYVSELQRIGDLRDLKGHDPYHSGEVTAMPMAIDWDTWDNDLMRFMTWHDTQLPDGIALHDTGVELHNPWFYNVAGRVALARWQWTNGMKPTARRCVEHITAPDWRKACTEWMNRRLYPAQSSLKAAG